MTVLRQRMTEDMQVRNLSPHTQASYLQQVSLFARYFHASPDALTAEHIRTYQIYLTNEKKLAPNSIHTAVAALRFLYRITLKKGWTFEEDIPLPKKPQKLPVVLSPEEVVHFPQLRGVQQTSGDPDHVLRGRPAHFGSCPPEGHRHRQRPDGCSRRAGQRPQGSVRDALAQAAGDPAKLLESRSPEGVAVSRHS
jgi:hypothetical protein